MHLYEGTRFTPPKVTHTIKLIIVIPAISPVSPLLSMLSMFILQKPIIFIKNAQNKKMVAYFHKLPSHCLLSRFYPTWYCFENNAYEINYTRSLSPVILVISIVPMLIKYMIYPPNKIFFKYTKIYLNDLITVNPSIIYVY